MAAVDECRTPVGALLRLADIERDPFTQLARLRTQEPVSWLPHDRVWLITSHALVDEAHRDQARFTTDLAESEVRRLFGVTMLTTDGAAHRVHHAPFAAPLRRRAVEDEYVPLIRALAEELVADIRRSGTGTAELVSRLAWPLALRLVAAVFGLREDDGAELEALVLAISAADGITVSDEVRRRASDARMRFGEHLRMALEQTPSTDPRRVLAVALRSRGTLSDQAFVDNTINLIFGAVDPTAILIATAIWALLGHPEQLALVRGDRQLLASAVKEAARWHPPFAASVRYVAADTTFAGVELRRGEKVYLMILSANRDERTFDAPERFEITRSDLRRSIAFGRGVHHCIGEALAELAAREALDAALSSFPGLRLDPGRPSQPSGVSHHQLDHLHVRYDA